MSDAVTLDVEQIKKLLPHRAPMLLVERLEDIVPFESATGYKAVSFSDPWFAGHFPERAVMPGVLIVEAMAQAAAVLSLRSLGHKNDGKWVYYFVGIDGARFKRPVVPGDTLTLEVTQGRVGRGIGKFNTVAKVGGQVVSEAELLCALREL